MSRDRFAAPFARLLVAFASLLATIAFLPGALVQSPPAAAAGSGATLSVPLGQWLATASSTATFKTIITFASSAGVSKIDSLNVGATKLSSLPIAFASLSAAQIREVASWPEVRSLWHDQRNAPVLDSDPLIGADKIRAGTGLKRPYTGAGVNVAVIDTGVDGTHPDLPYGSKVDQYAVAGNPFNRDPMTFTATPTGDTDGHGTHVSSIIGGLGTASAGRYAGVATGAHILMFKTDVGGFLLDSYILGSFDWILSHPGASIRVANNSWGCCAGANYNPDDPINVATKALYDANVTVTFAAGNDGAGGANTLNPYCTSPWVICVAAGTWTRNLATFSSRGRIGGSWNRDYAQRTNTGLYRPTITAPGLDIEAAKSSTATAMATGTDPANPYYTTASGTSMAAPHVAGTAALMLEARPGLKPQNIIDVLEGTATNMPAYELFETGLGYLDAYAAVVDAEKGKIQFPPPVNGKTPQYSLTGSAPFSGTALTDTWQIKQCPDNTPGRLLQQQRFAIGTGVEVVYTEASWSDETQLLFLVLYDPSCKEAAISGALLDIGAVSQRSVRVALPVPGTWTVAVYGRVNLPTAYTGVFQTYDQK